MKYPSLFIYIIKKKDQKTATLEIDVTPVDFFSFIFLLFDFEDVMNEKLLKFFVGVVDEKLLETAFC